MTEKQTAIKSVTVYWDKDRVEDYDDIVGFGVDQELGFPRLSIQDSKGKIENINLSRVESWTVEVEVVH